MSTSRSARWSRERGSTLLIALVSLVVLLSVGGVTILAVQSEVTSAGSGRFNTVALYAAESGAWAGIDFLRGNCNTTTLFSALVSPSNASPQWPTGIYGNQKPPGDSQNPFDSRLQAWYEVEILNNLGDPGFAQAVQNDRDSQVIVHAIGHGPNQTQAVVEMEVRNEICLSAFCDSDYAQQNLTALNTAGFADDNPCASNVDGSQTRSITP